MADFEDSIAEKVLEVFDSLPKSSKPVKDGNGVFNWVPLSGIVISSGTRTFRSREWNPRLKIVLQARGIHYAWHWRKAPHFHCGDWSDIGRTGMKCLPSSKVLLSKGCVIHDWHAEILAIRSFNHFLLNECHDLVRSIIPSSEYLRLRGQDEVSDCHPQPFTIRENLRIHMYCSEAPCGDASMELTMKTQDDATPWPVSGMATDQCPSDPALHGRGYFSELGAVRRKPGR